MTDRDPGGCPCGAPLMFSARARGDGRCGPCSRNLAGTPAIADRVNHDPGDEDDGRARTLAVWDRVVAKALATKLRELYGFAVTERVTGPDGVTRERVLRPGEAARVIADEPRLRPLIDWPRDLLPVDPDQWQLAR